MKQPVAKLECSSCKNIEYRILTRSVGERTPNYCHSCKGDMFVKNKDELPNQLKIITDIVCDNFHVWDFNMNSGKMEFLVKSSDTGESFYNLMKKLDEEGYTVKMNEYKGEIELVIQEKSIMRDKGSVWLNIALFLLTIGTTFGFVGYFFLDKNWLSAALFSISILAILGSHEIGHMLAARKHGVHSSFPYFIPAPTLIGTLGALIKIKSPIPTKKALIDLGISGPLIGFLLTIPITVIGLILSDSSGGGIIGLGELLSAIPPPLIFSILGVLTIGEIPASIGLHPFAFAGFIGFFVTWLNLMPAGQLDGGHVTRGLLSRGNHFLLSRIVGLTLVIMGFVLGIFLFLFWGILVLFLFGMPHPGAVDDKSKLYKNQRILAFIAIIIFILCLPIPKGLT